ncbi:crossover junction endodeoxyribonuclease RuvC [Pollutibacter soli]|uniref:crossover junction endodeoxyribonuclease RuvC n=1 Tax=Pollutibacter soli TaxID=3034157 RepID=UPI003013EF27
MQENSRIILGVDPGTVIMGYSVLSVCGKQLSMVEMNVVKLSSKKDMYERLLLIHQTIQEIITKYGAQELAIEAPFFGKNVQSMLKLGRAQGVAIAVAMQKGLPVAEYSPKKVKQSITGNGNADKEKVWEMIKRILPLKNEIKYFDASDALAVALCHHFSCSSPVPVTAHGRKKTDWESFIRLNPHRIS